MSNPTNNPESKMEKVLIEVLRSAFGRVLGLKIVATRELIGYTLTTITTVLERSEALAEMTDYVSKLCDQYGID